jgi:hypothetical protein
LAARLLAADAMAESFLELADDLEETVGTESNARKVRIRLALLADVTGLLDEAIESVLPTLTRYFVVRADVEGEESADVAAADSEEEDDAEEVETSGSPLIGALADLAVPARVSQTLDEMLGTLVDDCRRFRTGLDDVLESDPDVDVVLDFLSSAEADLQHALHAVLRPEFVEGETPYRPGFRALVAQALTPR